MRRAWRAARRPRPGLTLIELLLAIALTGALFVLLLPPLQNGWVSGPRGAWLSDPSGPMSEPALADRGFIGVQLDPTPTEEGYARIRGMVAGSPAHQAGAWPGDAILRVDGRSTRNRGMKAVVQLITRGRPGTRVRLTVRRPGSGDTRELRIVRASFYDVFLPGIAGQPLFREFPGTVRLWDTTTGRPIATVSGHGGPIRNVAFSADGKILATVKGGEPVTLSADAGPR